MGQIVQIAIKVLKAIWPYFKQLIVPALQAFFDWLTTKWFFTAGCALTTIICLIYQAIQNPEGALNQFMITVISSVIVLFPSTPEELKMASLLKQFNNTFPLVGSYVLTEIFTGIVGLGTVFLFTKLWKLLPFV